MVGENVAAIITRRVMKHSDHTNVNSSQIAPSMAFENRRDLLSVFINPTVIGETRL